MIISCSTIVDRRDHVHYLTVSKRFSDNCTCSLTEQNTTLKNLYYGLIHKCKTEFSSVNNRLIFTPLNWTMHGISGSLFNDHSYSVSGLSNVELDHFYTIHIYIYIYIYTEGYSESTEPTDAVNILPLARFEPTTSATPPSTTPDIDATNCATETSPKKDVQEVLILTTPDAVHVVYWFLFNAWHLFRSQVKA